MPAAATLENLAAYALQIAVITALAGLLLRVIPVASPGFRYAYWRIVLAAALVAPWILRAAPPPVEAMAAESAAAAPVAFGEWSGSVPALTGGGASWLALAPWLLVSGLAVRLLWVAFGIARLRRLRRTGIPVIDPMYQDIQDLLGTRAELRTVPGLAQPVTFGVWRPVVLLPEHFDTSADTIRRAAVTHELFHVQRRDWLAVLGEEALRAIFWFHPAIWWMTSRIQQAREEFTDHLAVLATGSRRAYMEALLAFSDGPSLAPAPAFARRPHLFHRIVLLSKENVMSSRRIVISGAALAVLLATGGWYASEAFPVEQGTSPFAPAGAGARSAQTPGMPNQQVNPITPENPIPRRVFATAVPYPSQLAGSGYSAVAEMRVVLDPSGAVASVERGAVAITSRPREQATAPQDQAMSIFSDTAAEAIRQWRYDRPFNAPIAFYVAVTFSAVGETRVSQSETGRGVVAGRGDARLATAAERAGLERTIRETQERLRVLAQETGGLAAPPDGGPVRVGSGIRAPVQLRKVNPVYPAIARSARVQGVVILELNVDTQGFVTDARILRSIPLLDQAALDAVRQWQYQPTLLNGVPVPIVMTATVQFTLDQP
jgi:TonB family protein